MLEDQTTEEVESSTTEDEEVESSTTEETQVEEATSEQATEKEPPFHEHPAWKDFQSRKDAEASRERERADRLERQLIESTKPRPTPDDPYAGLTDEEKRWYQQDDKRVARIAERISAGREEKLRQEFQAEKQVIYSEFGKLAANQFLEKNSDIKQGSPELEAIISEARESKVSLEKAKRIVMYDKQGNLAVEKVKKAKERKLKEKQEANLETSTVNDKGLPAKDDESVDATMAKQEKALGGDFW